jgi:hypothetical protein
LTEIDDQKREAIGTVEVQRADGTRRTFEAQYQLTLNVQNGKAVTNAGPGESNHNYGQAVDIGFKALRWLKKDGTPVEVSLALAPVRVDLEAAPPRLGDRRLDEQLTDQAAARRAHRGPDAVLSPAAGTANKEQCRPVGKAGGEHHQRYRGQPHRDPVRVGRKVRPDERRQDDRRAGRGGQLARHTVRAIDTGDANTEFDDGQGRGPVPPGRIVHRGAEGQPQIDALGCVPAETGRHHADDLKAESAVSKLLADGMRIGSESVAPQRMTQHRHRRAHWRPIVVG